MHYLVNRKREKLMEYELTFGRKIFVMPTETPNCAFC
jgi:ribonuclease E